VLAVETFPRARPPFLFFLAGAFALVEARFPTFRRVLVELWDVAAASERFRASFEEADFGFGLTAALLRLSVERALAALPRVALSAGVVFCLEAAVAPVLFVDFLRAAIVKISTP